MNPNVRSKLGKTFLGGTEQKENISLLTPEQQSFLSSALGTGQSQLAGQAYSDLLQPYSPEAYQDIFQKSFVDPATKTLQQQIIPALKESYLGEGERESGALNRALAQSASDLSSSLGSQYMNFFNQQQQNKLAALSGLGSLAGGRTFEPQLEQTQGILGPLLAALAKAGIGFATGGPPGAALGAASSIGDFTNKPNTASLYNPYTGVNSTV